MSPTLQVPFVPHNPPDSSILMSREPPRIHSRGQDPLHEWLIPLLARLQQFQIPDRGALPLRLHLHQQFQPGQGARMRQSLFRLLDSHPRGFAGDVVGVAGDVQPGAPRAEAQGFCVPAVGLQEQGDDGHLPARDGGVESVAPEGEGQGGGVVQQPVKEDKVAARGEVEQDGAEFGGGREVFRLGEVHLDYEVCGCDGGRSFSDWSYGRRKEGWEEAFGFEGSRSEEERGGTLPSRAPWLRSTIACRSSGSSGSNQERDFQVHGFGALAFPDKTRRFQSL